ncbi:hypothetical protein [Variovorax rhizosphaerae]|uniref:Uncharacterized protein n=1 Tax=Variovorax rhizosphaerae TaxID=1836200 RepID=A0ABU8WTU7_9BURK
MSTIVPIAAPLPGERVIALQPGNASDAATDWLRRPHLFAGRTLSAATLAARQAWAAGRIAQRGQAFTAGVVNGLEVNHRLEAVPPAEGGGNQLRLFIEPGQALAASGEDITLTRPISLRLADLPVLAPPAWFSAPSPTPPAPPPDPNDPTPPATLPTLDARSIGTLPLSQLLVTAGARMSRVGILVAQPVVVDVSSIDPNDPCDFCTCGGAADDGAAYEDVRIGDGLRLLWYPWPEEWRPLPTSVLRFRNALAHAIFEAEAALAPGEVLPWADAGVALALFALDTAATAATATTVMPLFSDRASVVRQGGRAREARLQPGATIDGRTPLLANSRLPALWQARIEQFAEQIAELGDPAPPPQQLADPFLTLPPCGLLPTNALNFATWRSDFFPPLTTLDAVPVPIEQLDAAFRDAAALAPVDLSAPNRVRLLVPVPQASWEPRLLKTDVIDPEFNATLNRFLLRRARELGARQGLRLELALLTRVLTGQPQTVPAYNDDPLAVETETLIPWGPPPVGGGHRSALRAGAHQHYFDSATEILTPGTADAMSQWVFLDPDNPPRMLMLQWHVRNADWEHRAIWGEDLMPGVGAPNTAGHRLMGPLPDLGRWVQLEVLASVVGTAGQAIDGMAFTLFDGRAAYGMAGTRTANQQPKWFCNVLPLGARRQGDEPWDLLTQNDLWAPFEPARGVVPAIPDSVPAAPNLVNGGHLEPSAAGIHQHYFEGANPTFALGTAEQLYAWVYIDPNDPPREVMLQWHAAGNWEHRAFWGFDLIPWGTLDTNSRRRIGGLPPPGQWVRLVVQKADVGLSPTTPVDGMAFTLHGGSAAFAASGAVTITQTEASTGVFVTNFAERPWFAFAPPPNARPSGTWLPIEARDLYAPTNTSRIGRVQTVASLLADPLLAVLSEQERAQLTVRGLGPFVDYLRARIDRTDDLTDHGFVKMQSDIYRVRQLMLSSTDALRIAVSPTLASIAKAETAVASQAQISSYIAGLKVPVTAVARAAAPAAAAPLVATPPLAASRFFNTASVGASNFNLNLGVQLEAAPKVNVRADLRGDVQMKAGSPVQQVAALATYQPIYVANMPSPVDVVLSAPVIGKSPIRTTAIAERLKASPSQEARDYALATRRDTVLKLIGLLNEFMADDGGAPSGLFSAVPGVSDEFYVFGLENDPFLAGAPANDVTLRRRRLTDFRVNPALQGMLDDSPPLLRNAAGQVLPADESTLFSQLSDLSDNTVAMLRQLEGRINGYRNALTRCELALTALQGDRADAAARVGAAGDRLAEARHDVGVARALIAEEQARIDAVNARRAQVLAEEVRFLAFMRPRETATMQDLPRRTIDPALAEAPVPACLRDHADVPDELEEMLRVVREAPASWFVQAPTLLRQLDRSDLLLRTLQTAQLRTTLVAQRVNASAAMTASLGGALRSATPTLGVSVSNVIARQTPLLAARVSAVNSIDLVRAASLSWQALHAQAVEVVSLGDVIDGDHGRSIVSQRAANLYGSITQICACLHAEFCGVSASIRLDWAELMSQYDAAPSLRNGANLPRWSEIDSTDRRQMQAYIDWLFAQVDPAKDDAQSLVSDLVRMCLLLASHAPVGRIVAGRMPRPVVGVRPGVRIPLVALDAGDKLRVGMQAMLYRGSSLVARAAIEDVGSGEVSARVLSTVGAQVDLGLDVRVQFAAGEVVSAKAARVAAIASR